MLNSRELLLSKYVNTIKKDDNSFRLFHSIHGGLCEVDNEIYKVLNYLKKSRLLTDIYNEFSYIDNSEINDIVNEFFEKGFIIYNGQNEIESYREHEKRRINRIETGEQIKAIQLVVSNKCNYNCKYCFTNSIYSSKEREIYQKHDKNQIMTPENAINYIEKVIEKIIKANNKELSIQFFGGEPLTNWNTIERVLDHYKNEDRLKIDYSIVTNGALITPKISEYLKKYNVPVIMSFDSPNRSHRYTNDGSDSIKNTIKSLEILKENNNYIAFNSVLSRDTFDYFNNDIVDFAQNYNVSEIGILLDLNPSFYKDFNLDDIVNKVIDLYEYGLDNGIIVTGYWHITYQNIIMNKSIDRGYKTCSATGGQLSIEPMGVVFACKGSSGYFGNMNDLEGLLSCENYIKYASRSFINSNNCINCELIGHCSGLCLGAIEKKYGNIMYMDKGACDLYKLLIRRLIEREKNIFRYDIDESK
ncbi:radical SAM cyclopropyl synthase TigE [Paramaledivibacter caminithermalis]|uniref:Radical SAM cyclopropyl synthase TigE n=1 Tax=Paramaledivibacter caminithermalis (strain DSM 15212 / CIP 107654 / DViRD3) TaxID=1121301 RepID=TIGE_PARC5|nr:radical SAM protein [Paramaledivibacter caminithermalis]SHK51129.1 uncharacterized protein SAMN02745912_03532 [Paramaledivibacter caminithermalis DSM 15212]